MTKDRESQAAKADFVTPAPYLLRVGVTGHRALDDEPGVRAAVEKLVGRVDVTLRRSVEEPRSAATSVRDALDFLDRFLVYLVKVFWWTMPITPGHVPRERQVPLKWRVTSALAKGVDQIVADVILKDVHGELHAVLPLPEDEYAKDFEGADLERFRELAAKAAQTTVIEGEARPRAYRRAGERVVDDSDILIAVWDGDPERGEGGTGEIVRYAFRKGVPVYRIDADNPGGEPTLLDDATDLARKPRALPRTAKAIALRYHQLCAYYRAPAFSKSKFDAMYRSQQKRLHAAATECGLTSPRMASAIARHLDDFVFADLLAVRHEKLRGRGAKLTIVFAALAVTAAAVHLLAFEDQYWLIGFEIAFMAAAGILLRVCMREGWHEKWLNDRYLAERLRCQMFLEGLGMPWTATNSVQKLHPFYEGPAAWIDRVLRTEGEIEPPAVNEDDPACMRAFLDKAWIGYQANRHKDNAQSKRLAHELYHGLTFVLFCLTLLCAFLHWFHVGEEHSAMHVPGLPEVIKILAVALPAWGGAVHGVSHLMEHRRIGEQSRRMHRQLSNLVYELNRADDLAAIADVAERADKLMAVENSEWMMTLAYRKPELHV